MPRPAAEQPKRSNIWRNMLYLWTVAAALVLAKTTTLGLAADIALGFLVAATLVTTAYVAAHRRARHRHGRH